MTSVNHNQQVSAPGGEPGALTADDMRAVPLDVQAVLLAAYRVGAASERHTRADRPSGGLSRRGRQDDLVATGFTDADYAGMARAANTLLSPLARRPRARRDRRRP